MTLLRMTALLAVLLASFGAPVSASACGYSSGAEIGSDNCTGGATAGDRDSMDDIRAGFAAQRAMRQH